jgi:hypothetical protein
MPTKTAPRRERSPRSRDTPRETRRETPEPLPTWRNTRPRANQEVDRGDLERSRERFEALLGR